MAKREKMGKVIPFPKRSRSAAKDPMGEENPVRALGKEAFMALMDGIAPVPSSLEPALKPPAKLYMVGDGPSVSSDPDKSIAMLAFALVRGEDAAPGLLEDAPDYGIHFTYRKSTSFCVLLDKSRKILVTAALGNSLGGGLDWDLAVTAIDIALEEREALERKGEKFDLLVSRELAISTI